MRKRTFLKSATLAGLLTLTAHGPALAQSDEHVLRFVPDGDLSNFDPIWGTAYTVRNAAMMVWDTLYGVDENLAPQLQMLESDSVSEDGLVWTFTLRHGLTFHDDTPVTAEDVVASLDRWKQRDVMGLRIAAVEDSLVVVDEKTFEWHLNEPFPKMRFALGKANAPVAFIMPARIAATDPFEQITEYVGSGPMRFVADEWQVGAMAVFEKFDGYVPREEPSSWLAGGKVMNFDRVEWITIPDAATAVNALTTGEVDWLEKPLPDLAPLLEASPHVETGVSDPLGVVQAVRLNHTQPPFDDVGVRRAVAMAMNQSDYSISVVGDKPDYWQYMYSYFTPGTPLYTEVGSELVMTEPDLESARQIIADKGLAGTTLTVMVAQDLPANKAIGDVTAGLMEDLGFEVEYVATTWGNIQARRQSKAPAAEGGWNIFHTSHSGTDTVNPAAYIGLQANGDDAWFGWPSNDEVQAGIAEWYAAETPEAEFAAAEKINAAAMDTVVFGLAGFTLFQQAWRSDAIANMQPAPLPLFWGIEPN
ncbi:ABC transporter substrate-binding protein [Sagittula stellata]|uniref:ABC transporter substrate-binding protein n=1 Tax=Sagittula stellata TaxID=52603 RepID=UPI00058ACDB7|nr:ABC transporter substrate-binding protein [Sagittula stellata]